MKLNNKINCVNIIDVVNFMKCVKDFINPVLTKKAVFVQLEFVDKEIKCDTPGFSIGIEIPEIENSSTGERFYYHRFIEFDKIINYNNCNSTKIFIENIVDEVKHMLNSGDYF